MDSVHAFIQQMKPAHKIHCIKTTNPLINLNGDFRLCRKKIVNDKLLVASNPFFHEWSQDKWRSIISNRTHRVKDLSTGSVGWVTVWQSNALRVWCENYSMLGFSISTEANSSVTYITLHSHSLTVLNFLFCFYIFIHSLISWFFAHWPIGMFKRILLVCVIHCSNETFCGHCGAILKAMVTNTSAVKRI